MSKIIDLTGKQFGRLTVIKECGRDNRGGKLWLCRCNCGNKEDIIVKSYNLTHNHTRSCGCLVLERITKHNMYKTRLYSIWQDMKQRCYYKKSKYYKYYGGKGIIICEEWLDDFSKFAEWSYKNGYRDDLTIDRIDSKGNYEPNNCRWVTNTIQSLNKPIRIDNKAGYKGVHFDRYSGKWRASITINKKDYKLGRFTNIEDAIAVRKAAEEKYHKPVLQSS